MSKGPMALVAIVAAKPSKETSLGKEEEEPEEEVEEEKVKGTMYRSDRNIR